MSAMSMSSRPARRAVIAVGVAVTLGLGAALTAGGGAGGPLGALVRNVFAAAGPGDIAADVVKAINDQRAVKQSWVGPAQVTTAMKPLTVLDCTTQQADTRVAKMNDAQQGSGDLGAVRAACSLHAETKGVAGPARATVTEIVTEWMKPGSSRDALLGAYTNIGVACKNTQSGAWLCEAIVSNPAQVGGEGPDKPVGQFPVMIFGDSYTAGNGVGDGVTGWRVGLPGGDPKTNSYQSPRSQGRVMAEILARFTGRPYCAAGQADVDCVVVNDYSHSGSVTIAPPEPGPDADKHPGALVFPVVPANLEHLKAADLDARSEMHKIKTLEQQVDQALLDIGGKDAMLPQGVIIVGIGGNDIGFADIAKKVLIPWWPTRLSASGGVNEAEEALADAEALLAPAIVRAEAQ
ncbi:MAG: hypothetical protein FWE61_00255, partial [Micrococcales bacterium]|nr:hypothetical protein [Micrococcales bacterium]